MPRVRNLIQNGTVVEQPIYNNVKLTKWIHNGVVVWEKGAYPIEDLHSESFDLLGGEEWGRVIGTTRHYIGLPYKESVFSEGDSFEINGLTCTMEAGYIFVINGKATENTRISYAMGTMTLPPAQAGQDTDMLCYGLPIDAPDGISIEFTASGYTESDTGLGCVIDLHSAFGNLSVSSAIVINEGTTFYDVKITPTMQLLNQGVFYQLGTMKPYSSWLYKCRSFRYKDVENYWKYHITIPVTQEWSETFYRCDVSHASYTMLSRSARSSASLTSALFAIGNTLRTRDDWETTNTSSGENVSNSVTPYITGEFVVYSPTKDSLNPLWGIVDRKDFYNVSGEINGLRQFVRDKSQNDKTRIYHIGLNPGSEYIGIRREASVTQGIFLDFTTYDAGLNEVEVHSFPTEGYGTYGIWFLGEYFLCVVRYTFYQYKLVKVDLDGTETEIYDFKDYYAGFVEGDAESFIDLSGNYAFIRALKQGSGDLLVVDGKENIYVVEDIEDGFSGYWQVGQYSFEYNGNTEKLQIAKIGIPIR